MYSLLAAILLEVEFHNIVLPVSNILTNAFIKHNKLLMYLWSPEESLKSLHNPVPFLDGAGLDVAETGSLERICNRMHS